MTRSQQSVCRRDGSSGLAAILGRKRSRHRGAAPLACAARALHSDRARTPRGQFSLASCCATAQFMDPIGQRARCTHQRRYSRHQHSPLDTPFQTVMSHVFGLQRTRPGSLGTRRSWLTLHVLRARRLHGVHRRSNTRLAHEAAREQHRRTPWRSRKPQKQATENVAEASPEARPEQGHGTRYSDSAREQVLNHPSVMERGVIESARTNKISCESLKRGAIVSVRPFAQAHR